jgi:HlyD family type I secretion membrane fusion protein
VAPLAKAVSAPAVLTVKGERKKVQHLEGGIVEAVFVEDGDFVKKSQLLARLSTIQAGAMFSRFDNQLNQALAYEARLRAELAGEETVVLDGELLSRLQSNTEIIRAIENEEKQLIARRATYLGHIGILKQRIAQLRNEIDGIGIQKQSRLDQREIFSKELVGLEDLHDKGFFPRSKILAMQRAMVQLDGAVGADSAQMARARSAMGEAERQIINVKQELREAVVQELRDARVTILDLKEQVAVAKDILKRTEIRAPRSGIIQGLAIHTIGGVIGTGETLMEIVPQDEQVVVDVKVQPTDIESVALNQTAEVRFSGLNARSTPSIYGTVIAISGDSLSDPASRTNYFHVKVDLPGDQLAKLEGVKLSAGMPVEVLIQTGERTALEYLLQPLTDSFKRGLNEE